jgi:hypothetical protein
VTVDLVDFSLENGHRRLSADDARVPTNVDLDGTQRDLKRSARHI